MSASTALPAVIIERVGVTRGGCRGHFSFDYIKLRPKRMLAPAVAAGTVGSRCYPFDRASAIRSFIGAGSSNIYSKLISILDLWVFSSLHLAPRRRHGP